MFYRFLILILFFLTSCSSYKIEDNNEGDIPIRINLSEGPAGEKAELMYPIGIYYVNQKNLSLKDKTFNQGEPLILNLPEGEFSINVFDGLRKEEFDIVKNFEQKQVIRMKENNISTCPLMAAHTVLEIKKATDINLIPVYIVTSVEFELENIPEEVSNIIINISPVYNSYEIEGKSYVESSVANIKCTNNGSKWTSEMKYLFPSSDTNTKITINMDYDNKTKSYSYTLKKKLECGKPYKFKGRFNGSDDGDNGDGGDGEHDGDFELDGDFCISGWDMEEEISLDFGDGDIDDGSNGEDGDNGEDNGNENGEDVDIETFYVNEIPSVNDVFGPLFIWKSKEVSSKEAVVTVISPHQWPDKLASEAMKTLESYSVDDITGWRMFTESEVHEFFSDFQGGNSDINTILRENGFEVFYTEDIYDKEKSARYLCDDARKTFKLLGTTDIRKAGEKTKYYLRPVKTIRLIIK